MAKRALVVGGLAAVLIAGGIGAAVVGGKSPFGRKDEDKPPVPLEFTAGEVVRPQPMAMSDRVEFSGPLVAPGTAVVRAKAAGTLVELRVADGHRVRAGQLIGRIDMAELASRVAERQANLASAQASVVQAERTHQSNERLAAQQFISAVALDNSRAALDAARAQRQAAQASLEATRVNLRDGTLAAPIGGIVAKRHVLPGEKVSAEQQVVTIVDLARLELAGSVGTHEVSRLRAGMTATLRVEGLPDPVAGRIARIAPAAEPGTRSIGVTIELDNPNERLRAGQYALASVDLADDRQRLTLPTTAIAQTEGQDHVWIIEGGVLARRAVTLGRRDDREGRVEVLQGLQPGAQVLAARFDNLREGNKASVVAGKGSAVASAAASAPEQLK